MLLHRCEKSWADKNIDEKLLVYEDVTLCRLQGFTMRIAFIVNVFPLLSETFILNQITGLIDRGHEVDIHAHNTGELKKTHGDVEEYSLLKTLNIISCPKGRLAVLGCLLKVLLTNISESKKILKAIKHSEDGLMKSLQEICQASNFMGKEYDIILCHFGPNGVFAASLTDKKLMSGKLVTVFHGYDMTTYLRGRDAGCYDRLFAAGDLFLPISDRWKKKLLSLGCPENKMVVHRMGIDVNKFVFRSREVDKDPVKLITVCRLVEKKGVEFGIRAVADCLDKYPGCRIQYRIVGNGPLFKELEGLIAELDVQENIQLLGWKDQDEVSALMDEADIYIGPSVTSRAGDQEGIPVVLMEAMAKGLIACATYHSGIPELLEDGVTGYLVPESDVSALSDKLHYVLTNKDKWFEISANGYEKVCKEYNIQVLNDRLESLLNKCIKGGRLQ